MTTAAEIELCYFCELTKPEGLSEAADTEMQEQYEYRLPPGPQGQRRGRIRIRKTTKNNESTFVETIKMPADPTALLGDMESNADVSEPYYNVWRSLYQVSGQRKIRYTFVSTEVTMMYLGNEIKLPPVKFEVDIFLDKVGKKSKWAKVDIEVQDIIAFLKKSHEDVDAAKFEINFSCLPLGIGEVVSAVSKKAEDRAAIDAFFKMYEIPYEAPHANQNTD